MKKKLSSIARSVFVALFLLTVQVNVVAADTNNEEVPFGGDSLFPYIVVVLTILAVAGTAIWMFRNNRSLGR